MTPEEFAQALTEKFKGERYASRLFSVAVGPKYTRIVQAQAPEDIGRSSFFDTYLSESVHCFIENSTGHVFKPASWKTPAKGVRYTSMEDALAASDVYGGYLYKR